MEIFSLVAFKYVFKPLKYLGNVRLSYGLKDEGMMNDRAIEL